MHFLSYAEEDGETAHEIASWLEQHQEEVFIWEDPRYQGGRFIKRIEEEINEAAAFIVLLSPSYLASTWCRLERELAMQREQDLQAVGDTRTFIYVLKIADGRYQSAGFLRNYNWVDATSGEKTGAALPELAKNLRTARLAQAEVSAAAAQAPGAQAAADAGTAADGTVSGYGSLRFRNRTDELRRVADGLTSVAGPHFWLVLAPPQLGKTWFLDRLTAQVLLDQPEDWDARLLDLREQPPEVLSNAGALLALLFGLPAPVDVDQRSLKRIAQGISRSGKSYICLLDSAELLTEGIASTLRWGLSQIHRLLQATGQADVRLALVVASRQEGPWRGVSPSPRLRAISLTEFNVDVAQATLRDLARQMKRSFSHERFARNAALVHGLSEGLPALIVVCLQWIRAEEWLEMGWLEDPDAFTELAYPYIHEQLLSPESLIPWDGAPDAPSAEKPLRGLQEALRVLAPYRLFTQSHLRYYLGSDQAFSESMQALNWSMEDLWQSIGGTALLLRPLNEPWQQIHPAIRRLLYRYYYKSDEQRAVAHREACRFVKQWADRQPGKEQVIGLVECLWHEACALSLSEPATMSQVLPRSTNTLSLALQESHAYTASELRGYAAERMMNDDEFQAALSGAPDLFDQLVEIVMAPQES